jgi:putative nucleotidyltransferase with HDIG domain
MKRGKLGLTLYVAGVSLAGAGALWWAVGEWGRVSLEVWQLALFIGLAGVLDLMVVPVAGGGGVAASFAVFFAGLLVLGPGPTAWVAALAGLWSEGVVRRRSLARVSFNAAHSVLSLLAAGWLYGSLGGEVGRVESGPGMLAAVAAAVGLWLLESWWVAVAVALEEGGGLRRRLTISLGPMLAWDGALASVGLLLALLYGSRQRLVGSAGEAWSAPESLFLGAIVLIPSGLLYYAYRLQGHLREVYAQSLRTLGALMEGKLAGSPTAAGHGERVAGLAAAMAQALQLPPHQVDQIRYAGYLHDIGKVGAPASLLQQTPDLFSRQAGADQLRQHPELGAQILAPIHFLQPAAAIVRAHHERWDGLGYPAGLRAHHIPLGARLLSLANAYVGMTSSTTHPPLPPPQALSRLTQAAGSRFDPSLLHTLDALAQRAGTDPGSSPPPKTGRISPLPGSTPGPASWR